jgi:anthranilate phosphoribosyltransferase
VPADFGLTPVHQNALAAANPPESAEIIRYLFGGSPGAHRDTVLAGCAAALRLVGRVSSLTEGVEIAAEAIDSGAAQDKLRQLAE